MALLTLENLTVEFATRRGILRALDGISLSIEAGEVLGLVGESGAGKSLTGVAVIGLLEPPGRIAGGQILLDGRRIDNLPYEAMRRIRGRQIGTIFQDPLTTLNPLYSVGRQLVETIQTHLHLSDADARKRAIAWLSEVGIPAPAQRIDAYPHEFSGGMRQRVVMLVTHDMGVIAETADRVAVMYAGRIAEIGPVAAVVRHPAHPYTEGLMGSIPSLEHRVNRLRQIDGAMPRLNAIPQGCAFNPRCPKVFDRCRVERPELMPACATRAACWLFAGAQAHA